jgi:hypothetical protein
MGPRTIPVLRYFQVFTPGRPATVVEYLNTPGVRDGLAGLEDQQVVAGHEGVRRAGHGLDGYSLAAAVRL